MDFEKKYEEALEKAKKMYNSAKELGFDVDVKNLETIFPELAELEDERIRNKLIKLIKMSSEVGGFALHKWEADEMLSWLERARHLYKDAISMGESLRAKQCEIIFPELAESDDERIRKWLIGYFRQYKEDGMEVVYTSGFKADDIIAWLEKQGDTNETINRDEFAQGVLKGAAINLITWIDYKVAEGNMCLSNTECKDIVDALASCNWDKIYGYMKKKLEKQALKPKWSDEDECYMKECISAVATKDSWSFEEKRRAKHWLKSLKQRME